MKKLVILSLCLACKPFSPQGERLPAKDDARVSQHSVVSPEKIDAAQDPSFEMPDAEEQPVSALSTSEDLPSYALLHPLGSGFDSVLNKTVYRCIDAENMVYSGMPVATLSFLKDYSADELLNEMGVGLYAKATYLGLLSAKIQGEIATTLATTDESGAFVYKFEVSGKSPVIVNPRLSETGRAAYQRHDPFAFREICGDSYVEQLKLGAQLYIGVKFDFSNKEEKLKALLRLEGAVLWGLIKFSKTWTKEEREILQNVRVRIEAFQIGGDPRKLEDIRKQITQDSCAADDIQRCSEALDRLLAYATQASGFASQLNELKVSSEEFKGPAILDMRVVPYRAQQIRDPISNELLSIHVDPVEDSAQVLAEALERLSEQEKELHIQLSRMRSMKDFPMQEEDRLRFEIARRGLDNYRVALEALQKGTCLAARQGTGDVEACVADIGRLELEAKKVLQAFTLSSR